MYSIENAYEAGWQARLQNKPMNELASKDWKDGYRDCEAEEFPQVTLAAEQRLRELLITNTEGVPA